MTDIGVPGSPDGPTIEPEALGELVVTFSESGILKLVVPKIPGRTGRQVVGAAAAMLQRMLDDDMFEKLEGDAPRDPPL